MPLQVTAHELVRRQSADFIGYTKSGNSYISFTCPDPSQIFTSSSSWWACASSDVPNGIATACVSATLEYPGDTVYTCNRGYTCNTGYLFSDLSDQFPLSEYGCLDGGTTSYYRTVPATASATTTTATSTSSTTASTTSSTPTSSKAWIAGAVVGPIVGIAILVGLGFWIWHLRRQLKANKLTQQPQQPGPATAVEEPKGSSWPYQSAELHSQPFIPEAPGPDPPAELET